jgi:hypothetical protein
MAVDFPDPFGPTIPMQVPDCASSETDFRIGCPRSETETLFSWRDIMWPPA